MKNQPNAREALERLKLGNLRFLSTIEKSESYPSKVRCNELSIVQQPFAIILGCSDARVPAEIVFDQGLGELFVIRVAGNIVSPSQIGSVEFAAEHFGTELVVVLGHTLCGAVRATIDAVLNSEDCSPNLCSIVDRIRPTILTLRATELGTDTDKLLALATRANVRNSVVHLRHGSKILEDLIENNQLLIVGAEYSLKTGEVDFFDC